MSLSMTEIRALFQVQLAELLGWPVDRVRTIYLREPVGLDVYNDVCYYWVQPTDEPINRQMDKTYREEGNKARIIRSYTRVVELRLIFYGENGYSKAMFLRLDLLSPELNRRLFEAGLRVVTDIAEPRAVWEEYRGQWLPRTDMMVRFNQKVDDERQEAEYLQGAQIVAINEQEERTVET
jgi:hypothetical protein